VERAEILAVLQTKAGELLDIDPSRVTEEASLKDDLDVDSLDLVEYTMAVEDALGLQPIPEDEYADARNIGDFVTVVQRHLDATASA
jgi:acyl carrier protein